MKVTENQQNLILAAVIVGVLFYAYTRGAFSSERSRQVSIQDARIMDGSQASLSDNVIENLVTSFHDSLGYNSVFYSTEIGIIYKDIYSLNDSDLLAVANRYAAKYPNDEYKSINAALRSRWPLPYSDANFYKLGLLDRLQKIGAV